MRITEIMINNSALSDLQSTMRKFNKLNEQLTSGKKVNFPSDNAAIASRMSNLDSRLREIERYQSNANIVENFSKMYDQILQDVSSVYTRVKSLAVQGANSGTLDSNLDRKSIADELEKINDHLISLANTSVSGKFIFGGAESDKTPVSDSGDIMTDPKANIKHKISVGGYELEYGITVYDAFGTKSGTSIFKIVDRLKDAFTKSDEITKDLKDAIKTKDNLSMQNVTLKNEIKEIEKRKLQAEAAGNTALAASLQTQIDEKNSSIATNETKIKELQGDPSAATPVKGLIESKSELLKKAAESIQNELGAIDEIQESSSRTISQVGGTQRLLELTNSRMENFKTFSEEFLATETDADPAKVYTDMAMQKSVMDAALKALAQIVPKTILDFM